MFTERENCRQKQIALTFRIQEGFFVIDLEPKLMYHICCEDDKFHLYGGVCYFYLYNRIISLLLIDQGT